MAAPPYAVTLSIAAAGDLVAERSLSKRALSMIRSLKERPERGHPLTGELTGCRSLEISQ